MTRITAVALAALLAVAGLSGPQAQAHDAQLGDLMLIHPTARPNMPNRPTAAYVTIANDGQAADRLVAAASPEFESAEIHNVEMKDGVMKMFPVEGIDIPADDTVELKSGSYHIMLFGAKRLFQPGDEFPLVLTFEKAGQATIEAKVEKIDPAAMGQGQMKHGMSDGGMSHGKPSN